MLGLLEFASLADILTAKLVGKNTPPVESSFYHGIMDLSMK